MHPAVIECSPPSVMGKSFFVNNLLFISAIFFKAFLMFLSILKNFKVFIPIFLKGSQFNSSSYNST